MPKTLKIFVVAYSTNLSPLLFVTSCRLCLRVMSLYNCSLPNFALKSPSVMIASFFYILCGCIYIKECDFTKFAFNSQSTYFVTNG